MDDHGAGAPGSVISVTRRGKSATTFRVNRGQTSPVAINHLYTDAGDGAAEMGRGNTRSPSNLGLADRRRANKGKKGVFSLTIGDPVESQTAGPGVKGFRGRSASEDLSRMVTAAGRIADPDALPGSPTRVPSNGESDDTRTIVQRMAAQVANSAQDVQSLKETIHSTNLYAATRGGGGGGGDLEQHAQHTEQQLALLDPSKIGRQEDDSSRQDDSSKRSIRREIGRPEDDSSRQDDSSKRSFRRGSGRGDKSPLRKRPDGDSGPPEGGARSSTTSPAAALSSRSLRERLPESSMGPTTPLGKGSGSGGLAKLQSAAKKVAASANKENRLLQNDKIVTINVSGKLFQTYVKTLRRLPGTLLARMVEPGGVLLQAGHTFLDRNDVAFHAILCYYRTDRLVKPTDVSDDLWNLELEYYKIDNPLNYGPSEVEVEKKHISMGMPKEEGWRKWVWKIFDDPSSSPLASYQSMFGILVILLAVSVFLAQTHPSFRLGELTEWNGYDMASVRAFFLGVESFAVAYFTMELGLRFLVNAKKAKFFLNFPNVIDLVAIVPFYIDAIPGVNGGSQLMMVRIFRLARVFRIVGMMFKLGKSSAGAKVLGKVVIGCKRELGILTVTVLMGIIVFSAAMYFCENPDFTVLSDTSSFHSAVTGMYWATITMTTVGYGDMTPTTVCGEAMACLAAFSGILCIGIPISVITAKFNDTYHATIEEIEREEQRKRFLRAKRELQGMSGLQGLGNSIRDRIGGGSFKNLFGGGFKKEAPDMTVVTLLAKKIFSEMDQDGSGMLDGAELDSAMKKLGLNLPEGAIQYMMEQLDTDASGMVDFEEFMTFVERALKGEVPTPDDIGRKRNELNKPPPRVMRARGAISRGAW